MNNMTKAMFACQLSQDLGRGGNNTPIVLETECDEMCSDKEKDMSNETSAIRRITPTECEILQGYPAGWTLIGAPVDKTDKDGNVIDIEYYYTDEDGNKKKVSDSVRYKALGNSICLPFWFYLLRRISAQYERPATLGSLFDGLGGFPLCWERCNGEGTALWASEIEPFCIAVTKEHFS